MSLGEYLKAAAAKPWKAGEHDCSAWPGKWAGLPLPEYDTDEQGQALVDEAGGLVPLWERLIGGALPRIEEPEAGSIGIIRILGTDGKWAEAGAIYSGERWCFLTPHGFAACRARAVAVWGVACPR